MHLPGDIVLLLGTLFFCWGHCSSAGHENIFMYFFLLIVSVLVYGITCYNNGFKLPAMGWNSWNQFGCNIDEGKLLKVLESMNKLQMQKVGYEFFNIDDCWMADTRVNGKMVANDTRFPHGMKWFSDKVHSYGFKFGLYSDVGLKTCQGLPGSFGFYEEDANTFAEWGVDYLKLDFCNLAPEQNAKNIHTYYAQMSKALNETGRPILFSICNWGVSEPWNWAPQISNSWRTTGDISLEWPNIMHILDINAKLAKFSGLYNYNDPDMLEVGVHRDGKALSLAESKTHFALWAFMNSPLILGLDFDIDENIRKIITNDYLIAMNQNSLGLQAQRVYGEISTHNKRIEIWVKILGDNHFGVLLFNRGNDFTKNDPNFSREKITIDWVHDLKVPSSEQFEIVDVWTEKKFHNVKSQFVSHEIEVHGSAVYLFKPVKN